MTRLEFTVMRAWASLRAALPGACAVCGELAGGGADDFEVWAARWTKGARMKARMVPTVIFRRLFMVLGPDFSCFDAAIVDRAAHPPRRYAASYARGNIPAASDLVPGISAQGKYTCVE